MRLFDSRGHLIGDPEAGPKDSNRTEQIPLVSPIHSAAKTAQENRTQNLVAFGTIVLAAMAVMTAIFTNIQLNLTRETIDSNNQSTVQMLRQMRNQNRAALLAALAARKQSELMQEQIVKSDAARESSERQNGRSLQASIDASRTDQRAWISVSALKTEATRVNTSTSKTTIRFSQVDVLVRNSGRTPAISVNRECCYLIAVGMTEPTPTWEEAETPSGRVRYSYWTKLTGVNHTTFCPGLGVFPPGFGSDETVLDLHGIGSGGIDWDFLEGPMPISVLYIVGKVTYRDIFPGTKTHTTTLCLVSRLQTEFFTCPSTTRMD